MLLGGKEVKIGSGGLTRKGRLTGHTTLIANIHEMKTVHIVIGDNFRSQIPNEFLKVLISGIELEDAVGGGQQPLRISKAGCFHRAHLS